MPSSTSVLERRQTPEKALSFRQLPEKDWSRVLIVALVMMGACLTLFVGLGDFPLFNPDEALYAEPAREMIEEDQYITTLLNYVVRYTKPPLCIWAMAAGYQIFGTNEFAARFFGAACGALLVAATYLFAEKYINRSSGLYAAVVLATAPLFIGTAREAITDMPLSLFVAGAIMSFFHGYTAARGSFCIVGWVLVGLAVMTKGPVGLILPVAILGLFHILRADVWPALKAYNPIRGAVIVSIIAVPWFAAEFWVTQGAYFQEFIVRENFQRFTSVVDHKGAWWYHLAAIAGGLFPWTLFLGQSLFAAIKRMSPPPVMAHLNVLSKVRLVWESLRLMDNSGSATLLCLVSSIMITVFFSVSVSKLIPYTVPAFPFLAVLIGAYLTQLASSQSWRRCLGPFLVLCVVFTAGWFISPVALSRLKDCPAELPSLVRSALMILLVGCVSAAALCLLKRTRESIALFCVSCFMPLVVVGPSIFSVLADRWETPLVAFSQYLTLSDNPVFVYQMRKPSVPFYLHRQVVIPRSPQELQRRLLALPCDSYVLTRTSEKQYLQSIPGCKILVERGIYLLAIHRSSRKLPTVAVKPQTEFD